MPAQLSPAHVAAAPRFLSQAQAKEVLGCSTAQLRKLIKSGSLRAFRLGKKTVRISATELERFAAQGGVQQ